MKSLKSPAITSRKKEPERAPENKWKKQNKAKEKGSLPKRFVVKKKKEWDVNLIGKKKVRRRSEFS